MARLPQPGGDSGHWGEILNDYLSQAHKADGNLKDSSVGATQLQNDSVTAAALAPGAVTKVDVGLSEVNNTADNDKPVSTAQQTALDLKADASALATKLNTADLDTQTAQKITTSGTATLNALSASFAGISSAGVILDAMNLGPFNLRDSGAVGGASAAATASMDHTDAIQAFINAKAALATALSPMCRVVIDCPPLMFRVQNLQIPGNVQLRLNGARFRYVDSSLNPPTGAGNYVFRCYGSYGAITNGHISGAGAAQPWIGGVWLMPAGAASSTSARSYQWTIDLTFDQLGGRALLDQGVGNHLHVRLAQNTLLSATALTHFMGTVEQTGTDGWMNDSEISPSVTTVSNGIAVPRAPSSFDYASIGTLSADTTFPLSNASVTVSALPASGARGGALLIAGHLVTYTGTATVPNRITGAYCADSAGTITSGTAIYPAAGYVAAYAVGGANNSSDKTVAEFGDVGIYIGNSTKAIATASASLTTGGGSAVEVDSTAHLQVTGTTQSVPLITGTSLTYPTFTYTIISEATLTANAALSTASSSVSVSSTAGWPSTGTFHCNGRTVTYTSIANSTTLSGCTISSGTTTLKSGAYIRSNTLQGCASTTGTITITSGLAICETGGGLKTKLVLPRSDFSRTHSMVITSGSGGLIIPEAVAGTQTADNTYDAFHIPASATVSFISLNPQESTRTSENRHARGILDLSASGTSPNEWIAPKIRNAYRWILTGNVASAFFLFGKNGGIPLTGATPSVEGNDTIIDSNTGATTVTNFTNGYNGQELTYLQGVNTTIANNANIVTKTGANITPPVSGYTALRFKRIGYGVTPTPAWYQL